MKRDKNFFQFILTPPCFPNIVLIKVRKLLHFSDFHPTPDQTYEIFMDGHFISTFSRTPDHLHSPAPGPTNEPADRPTDQSFVCLSDQPKKTDALKPLPYWLKDYNLCKRKLSRNLKELTPALSEADLRRHIDFIVPTFYWSIEEGIKLDRALVSRLGSYGKALRMVLDGRAKFGSDRTLFITPLAIKSMGTNIIVRTLSEGI